MNLDQKEKSGSETLLSDWMKAAAEFWGSIAQRGLGASEEVPKSQSQESLQSAAKMWHSLFFTLGEPRTMDTLLKGINAVPEIALKMAKVGWDGYFQLQQQWLERVGRIGKHTEAYKFEDLDQNVFGVWTEIYEKEFKQFLTIPQLGLTRFYQERMGVAMDKFNLFQAAMAEFIRLLYLPIEKSFRIMQEKIGKLTQEGKLPEDPKEYYPMWLKILEGHYMTLFKSPEYTRALSNTLNAIEDFWVARKGMFQDILQTLPVPTHMEMDELYREIYLLKKKVKELTKKVEKL
jgi:class III poly(R)-hydroxyalkanoic acid synthase PhaE subunit